MSDDAKVKSVERVLKTVTDETMRNALVNAIMTQGLVIGNDETVTIVDSSNTPVIYSSKLGDSYYEFRMVDGNRQNHGKKFSGSDTCYSLYHYEDGKVLSYEGLVNDVLNIKKYEKATGNVISAVTHNFSDFPTISYLKSKERRLKTFKKLLLARINEYQDAGNVNTSLVNNGLCFDKNNELIMEFLHHLCKVRGYKLSADNVLSWK